MNISTRNLRQKLIKPHEICATFLPFQTVLINNNASKLTRDFFVEWWKWNPFSLNKKCTSLSLKNCNENDIIRMTESFSFPNLKLLELSPKLSFSEGVVDTLQKIREDLGVEVK